MPEAVEETREQRDQRMQWWREAKFGLFIHWGVYAVPAGTYQGRQIVGIGEWIMHRAQIPVAEYKGFAPQFNPVRYDPEAWVRLAKEAGMKYIVITSKHHDGFALYGSEVTDWDVVDATPYGNDLLTPLAEAARRHGLRFGLYYSQAQDWVHPGGAKARLEDGDGWDEAHKGSFDRYLDEIAVPQVREILTKFEPDILWWDTPHLMTRERAERLRPLLSLRPGIITNNRLGAYPGDFSTPEQYIPATGLNYDWETCMTLNRTWGYKSYDHDWKSTETLIRNLVDIVSKGGNYLLNVGPTAAGEIPAPSIERLQEIGRWMRANAESIYGTTASPSRRPAWGRITTKAGDDVTTLYLHVFDWPAGGRLALPLTNEVIGAHLLVDGGRTFTAAREEEGLVVQLSGAAPDPIDSVVVLRVKGWPAVLPYYVAPDADGNVVLTPADADLHGERLRIEARHDGLRIGSWTDPAEWVAWPLKLERPGEFDVVADVATTAGSGLEISVGSERVAVRVPDTGGWNQFQAVDLGRMRLARAGTYTLAARAAKEGWTPVNLRSITLRPV